ncbi:hypothetical protein ANCCAN_19123 [Ancylostoma caninum]|uniref:Uncharacterized protein n=1 Tax=Ancylostoma caninum TaxID=29170 RepID=A0A368FW96_ANCCA|nr:hypothetical protein ANCCAN_19123 [Ancylostoma caninum]
MKIGREQHFSYHFSPSPVFRQIQDIITRLCGCCPVIGKSVRLQKKFRDTDIENEKLVIHSPLMKPSSNNHLEPRAYGMGGIGALIMARSSLATSDQRQEIKDFQVGVKV